MASKSLMQGCRDHDLGSHGSHKSAQKLALLLLSLHGGKYAAPVVAHKELLKDL